MGQIGKQKVPRKKVEKVWQLFTTEKKKMLYKNFIAHSHDQWLQCESGLLFSYQKMPASLGEYGSAFEELHPHHDRVNAPLTMCVCVCVQALSRVRLFVTPWTVAHQTLLTIGILQARILEWVAMPSSRKSSWSRDWISVSCMSRRILYHLTHQESPLLCVTHEALTHG